jgi:hypothetical protein
VAGDTPALYGGSRDRARCDKEAQLRFFEQNPAEAAAFVAALNSDPDLRWSGGTSLTVPQLPDYFEELTPMVLTQDTRVTNHGFRNGQPTPRQSVLQAGTAVLVDAYGVPRVRCECGNPLIPPKPVPTTPDYTGPRWPDFDPGTIIVINQTTVVINIFVLVDVFTGEEFVRPGGSDGSLDGPHEINTWTIEMNVADLTPGFSPTVSSSGEFTINQDGTITGIGGGVWTFEGDCATPDGTLVSRSTASGTVTIVFGGRAVAVENGRLVSIELTLASFTIDAYSGSPPDAECEQDLRGGAESWVAAAFTTIELPLGVEPVLASYENEGFVGDVTITPAG